MKRRLLALTLGLSLGFSVGMPAGAVGVNAGVVKNTPAATAGSTKTTETSSNNAAETADARLTKVMQTVKKTLAIPDSYKKFQGNLNENLVRSTWDLNWSKEGSELNITATEEGKVLNYYQFDEFSDRYEENAFGPHFPKLTQEQAKAKAQEFLNKVLTKGEKAVFDTDDDALSLSATAAWFRGSIEVNGLSTPLSFSMNVQLADGAVLNFWRDDVSEYIGDLPAAASKITQKDAAAKLKTTLALRLEYVQDGDTQRAVLRYLPEYGHEYYVDGATGELIDLTKLSQEIGDRDIYNTMDAGTTSGMGGGARQEPAADEAKKEASLSEAELEGVSKMEGLLSREKLDAAARKWTQIGLNGMELSGLYYRVNEDTGDVYASLDYAKKLDNKVWSRHVTLNAKTGALLNIYGSRPYDENDKATLTEETAKAKAEAFLKALWPQQFAKTELYDMYPSKEDLAQEKETTCTEYTFDYARKENGYFFPANQLIVRVDAVDGSIIGLDREFDDKMTFDSVEGIISKEKALEVWAGSYPMPLSYVPVPVRVDLFGAEARPYAEAGWEYYNTLKTGYVLGEQKVWYNGVDAKKGTLVTDQSESPTLITYSDLGSHWSKDAFTQLAKYGVGWKGGKATPDAALTQADYFRLLASMQQRYFETTEEGTNELYEYAYNRGYLTRQERADNKAYTRMEMVKILLDSFGYKTVAQLQNIFKCDFKDANTIPKDMLGYVALAQGLKLLSGDNGNFVPDRAVTRAETVAMIQRYLQR